jgi:3',5'-cyclic AMP phosphodiesterase CpdA
LRIAQISDFHFTRLNWNPLRLFSKRLLGQLNWVFSRDHAFKEDLLDPLPSLFQELQVDQVLLGGDFTSTALKKEFELAAQFVKKLGKTPWIAISGNHDVYTYRSSFRKDFYRYFPNLPSQETINSFTLSEHQIEAHRLNEQYWLIALDVCRATNLYSSRGLFSQKLQERMQETLSLIPANHSILVLCHYPFFQNDAHRRNLKGGENLQTILKLDPRIKAFLHGHTHRHTIADLQPSNLPLILGSGSCTELDRAHWNLIDLASQGCQVSTYHWNQGWKISHTQEIKWTR